MEPLYHACMTGLFNQSSLRHVKEAIYEEYRYPFSDASGYFAWLRMGGRGPAPQEWCRHYAYRKVSTPYGRGFSLN
jgi:hypothetical protein